MLHRPASSLQQLVVRCRFNKLSERNATFAEIYHPQTKRNVLQEKQTLIYKILHSYVRYYLILSSNVSSVQL